MKHLLRNVLSFILAVQLTPAPVWAVNAGNRADVRSVSRSNVNQGGNTNINRTTNVSRNVNRNTNVNVSRDIDVDAHGGYYGGGCCYHPVSTTAAVTAATMVTSVAIGSVVNTLPPSCTTVVAGGITYQQCGNTWYQPQFVSGDPAFVVVRSPR